ncbi:hypothetical protein ACWCY6_18245 [Streptomyces sp. 900105755]
MLGPTGTARFINRLRDLLADEVAAQTDEADPRLAGGLPNDLRARGAFSGLITRCLMRPDRLSPEAAVDGRGKGCGAAPEVAAPDRLVGRRVRSPHALLHRPHRVKAVGVGCAAHRSVRDTRHGQHQTERVHR